MQIILKLFGMLSLSMLFMLDAVIILISIREKRLPRGIIDWLVLLAGAAMIAKCLD